MKKGLTIVGLVVGLASVTHAQNVVGDWQGILKPGPAELRLVLHIAKSDDGSLKATLDGIDQGANDFPVTSISLNDSMLAFTVDSVHGSYKGTVNADGKLVGGTWSQGRALPLNFKRATAPLKAEHKPAKPSDVDGTWLGILDTGAMKLRVAFHITNTEDGLIATLDSLDQNRKGLPATAVTRSGLSLKLEFKQIRGTFEGKIDKGLTTVEGTWTQGGGSFPLAPKRAKDAAGLERRRLQNPVKPNTYREEEVAFDNKVAGTKLAATLTTPPGKVPFPTVVLIVGSGPHDREETVMGHRPFLVLSDYLTLQGTAVLRADKRGVGKSGGNFATATTADFGTDAGVAYLKTRSEVDLHRIGLIRSQRGRDYRADRGRAQSGRGVYRDDSGHKCSGRRNPGCTDAADSGS